MVFFLMKRQTPGATRTDTLCPYTTLFRSPRVDDRDQLFDLQALVALPRGRHQRDMAAAHGMAGEALRAPREAAFPAAEAGRGEQAAREQRRIAEHRHAIGERVASRARRDLVDEAFGEKGGVAVGIAAPAPGRQAEIGRAHV